MSITLPASLEAFVAYQEQLIHRKLSAAEQEATAEWLHIFNDVSTGGLDGAVALERIGYLIGNTADPDILRFLRAAREWIVLAEKGGVHGENSSGT